MVSTQLLNELKIIIKEDYGIELQPDEVSEIGNGLVQITELLLKIDYEFKNDNELLPKNQDEALNKEVNYATEY